MNEYEAYVKKAKKGDRGAFASLYAMVYEDMYHYALCVLRTKEDAQDAVSQTVFEAFGGIAGLRSADKFRSWIFTILRNVTRKMMRNYYTGSAVPFDKDIYETEDATQNPVHVEDKLMILDALRTLGDDERQIIAMHIFAGYDSNEIGRAMGLNPATVRSKGSRALAKMKEICHE